MPFWKPDKDKELKKLIETISHSKLRYQQEKEDIIPRLVYLIDDKDKKVRANSAFAFAQIASVVSRKQLELFLFLLRERGNVQPG